MPPSPLSRRTFLRHTAATLGLAALGSPLRAESKGTATFGLGFTLYGMKSLPLDEALTTCAQIGYNGVELCLLDGYPTAAAQFGTADRAKLRESLASVGLRISGLMENFSLGADDALQAKFLDRIKAAGQLAHDISPDAPPPLETVLGGKPAEWDQVKDRMAEHLHAWAKAAEEAKIVIAIKAHVMSAVQNPERLLWLWSQVNSPAIQLTYDYSHFQVQNLPFDATFDAIMPHARFIHVKDVGGTPEKVKFLLPGEGTIDYVTYFKKLQEFGYRGDVVVEVSSMLFKQPGYDPKEAAHKSYTALAAALEKAGLTRRA
ncbi:Xylose isomerase domain protein TIM barrel [Chthoniobacter flavus Ellin428]|uniref:Xylose isomerase domain protein TIM barrel n=1 Tax=Chthoniobacter flavus Ellin428 TaxID=497964 RepID=B4D429_9BACT|nr:sugar phosphate isomerase/epimerase [Chthoniobacter flavus]EDY19009.1 Xylose isomerase domain protein TIM barrel [Chthoniobacter flavus Ellin428]TCO93590.1 secreted protein [Chthoniobacter flavus]